MKSVNARATALVCAHFEALNERDLVTARRQLFFPQAIDDKPLTIYLDTMMQIAPFEVRDIGVLRTEDARQRSSWAVAYSVWLQVNVSCSLGEKSTTMVIWCSDTACTISARPSEWVLEKIRSDEAKS